jgi:hypothetical protein
VHAGIGAVNDEDVPAVVGGHVVGLDHLPADVGRPVQRAATEVGAACGGRVGVDCRYVPAPKTSTAAATARRANFARVRVMPLLLSGSFSCRWAPRNRAAPNLPIENRRGHAWRPETRRVKTRRAIGTGYAKHLKTFSVPPDRRVPLPQSPTC